MSEKLGISGSIAKKFLLTEITLLLALIGFLLGVFAVFVTPREEEPQIDVTFANVFIAFPGATAAEVEHLVSVPAEQVLSEIDGVKHIYSVSQPGQSVLTVEFKVGEARESAIVRLYNKLYSNQDWLPANLGVSQPIVKPKGIDDVPIVNLTLWTQDPDRGAYDLAKVAHAVEAELKRVPGTRDIYTVGGPQRVVHVLLDPQRMAGYDITLNDLQTALQMANNSYDAGALIADNQEILVQAGSFLDSVEDISSLVIAVHDGAPVYLSDVAEVRHGPDQPEQYTWFGSGPAADQKGISLQGESPAVTIAIAKKPGTNAVDIANQVIERFEQLKGIVVPEGVEATVTRNYGVTADQKAKKLIGKLAFATAFVVLLVLWALGWREAIIVGTAVVITLAMTLFASWAWGFTLNRVSLFALIFSIGILVDDAIVVVENIHRHMQMGRKRLVDAIPLAVDEVGGPTILATFAVIAALLPMAFVTGLMGPYMSPIPINASIGMLISLAVAFVVTPWLTYKVLRGQEGRHPARPVEEAHVDTRFEGLVRKILTPFLRADAGKSARRWLLLVIVALVLASVSLAGFKLVVLKMLPFDNKSEFQVIIDMPEGTPPEETARVTQDLARYIASVPEVTDYQAYVGTAAPINFNGLVRQYYLRSGANVADIQVNLVDKSQRERKSHEIARSMREPLQAIGRPLKANVKIVEVPPGPPVMSPLVAEIYGIDYEGQLRVAQQVRRVMENTADIVDVDDSIENRSARLVLKVDRTKAALLGVSQREVATAIQTALSGTDVGYLHGAKVKYPVPIRLELTVANKTSIEKVLSMKVRSQHSGVLVPLSEIVEVQDQTREVGIYHKDLLPLVYVTGDMAGELDSPLYGMFDIIGELNNQTFEHQQPLKQYLVNTPDPYNYSLKWDGEWQITYETFRDMGIAYSVGLLMIYLLVVAQFRSYLVPLIIMAPIPLTIIGVMPGHALLDLKYTATSMIGMIALAGIIVRNSILLVDFINDQIKQGLDFQEAVIQSVMVRAKPIALTGAAAMLGALFIITDPIFSGLAVSLIFGILVSTLLTLLVIPVMYYAFMRGRPKDIPE